MNIIKLYKNNETKLARVTQTYHWGRKGTVRTAPYVREVLNWAEKNGWSRKKPKAAA